MPTPSTRSAWNGIVRAGDEPGRERRGPEAVARPREAVADVGRVARSGSARRSSTRMSGPDGVGQRAGARRLDVDPLLAVVDELVDRRSPRPRRRRAAARAATREVPAREPVVGVRRWLRSEVTCTCSAPPTAIARCRSASAIGSRSAGDVHVALVRPRAAERAARGTAGASRSATHAATRRARTCGPRRAIAGAASHATTGDAEVGAVPTRPAPDVERARPAGTRAANGVERRRHGRGAGARSSPSTCCLVHVDGAAVHDAGRMADVDAPRHRSRSSTTSRARSPGSWPRVTPRVDRAVGRRDRASECYAALRGEPIRTGRTSTCTSATSGSCRSTIRDSNEGMARRVLLDAVRAARDPLDVPAGPIEDAARATTRSCAPRRRSTSCTSGSGPTATPRRCSRAARRSTRRERLVVAAGDDAHPHPRLTFTFPAIARGRLVVVTVAGDGEARRRSSGSAPARISPARGSGPSRCSGSATGPRWARD